MDRRLKPDILTTRPGHRVPVNGDAFRLLCDHVFWCNAAPRENPAFHHGDIVFCKIDEVWRIFRALRRTRRRVVLVTGEGSKPITPAMWKRKPPHVAAWFGTNMFAADSTAHSLPLGLGNAGAAATPSWGEISDAAAAGVSREKWLYANFGPETNTVVRGPLWEWLHEPCCAWITKANNSGTAGKKAYLEDLARHRFVLCPPGTGEDTHRLWEALYSGCFPVIRESVAMRPFAEVLPILMVSDFRRISESLLRDFAAKHQLMRTDFETLWLPFWQDQIFREKSVIKTAETLPVVSFLGAWLKEAVAVLGDRMKKSHF